MTCVVYANYESLQPLNHLLEKKWQTEPIAQPQSIHVCAGWLSRTRMCKAIGFVHLSPVVCLLYVQWKKIEILNDS